ncbi:Uncharacterized protein QTN25_007113 [Entamoeba marina]
MEKIIEEHRKITEQLRNENCSLREKAAKSLGNTITNTRNQTVGHVATLVANEAEIEILTKQLQFSAITLSKQTKQWNASIKKLGDTLAELGNLEIVGKTMEEELNEVDSVVRRIHSQQ